MRSSTSRLPPVSPCPARAGVCARDTRADDGYTATVRRDAGRHALLCALDAFLALARRGGDRDAREPVARPLPRTLGADAAAVPDAARVDMNRLPRNIATKVCRRGNQRPPARSTCSRRSRRSNKSITQTMRSTGFHHGTSRATGAAGTGCRASAPVTASTRKRVASSGR